MITLRMIFGLTHIPFLSTLAALIIVITLISGKPALTRNQCYITLCRDISTLKKRRITLHGSHLYYTLLVFLHSPGVIIDIVLVSIYQLNR